MFAVLGDIEFEVVTYWDGFDASFGMDYAEHARIEGKPGLQFIGEKLDEVSISLVFHDHYCQPDVELARLREAMVAHQALALVFGNGDYRGWFVITDIRATSQQTDGLGNVQALSAELSLREYIGDPKNPLTPPAVSGDDPNIDSWSDDADDSFSGSDMFDGLGDITDGLGEVSDALDAAEQAFDEAVSWAEDVVEQVEDAIDDVLSPLEDVLNEVLSPLDDVMQALEGITDGGVLTDVLGEVGQFASQIYDEISSALTGFDGITTDNFADLFSQALDVVRNGQSLMEECSPAVSKLAAAIITRSV
ncbi:phage tail protein [Salmonella enterica subsp. enterica serovar Hillegersberg]|uniref:phage tail protein n=1 Tax=Salmonella enterica TaxID=28901 RepID=UPI001D07D7F7|nr:phage tail protein [Salmonella enterica]MCB7131074.1 phage tail protein [Salmonella enterica subsp. enterica serovar Hillegersberg]